MYVFTVLLVSVLALWFFTVYLKKYAHGFCFAVLCCGYTLNDFPISIRLTSLALWQSNDCPVPAKQPWWIWINTTCGFIINDCITTTKQSTTKPCAYFLGYTVYRCMWKIHKHFRFGCDCFSWPRISWNNFHIFIKDCSIYQSLYPKVFLVMMV